MSIATDAMTGSAFERVTVLQGFTHLAKRSGELDGNLPVRAARYCGPVFEGSAAGFQIQVAQPMTVRRGRKRERAAAMVCRERRGRRVRVLALHRRGRLQRAPWGAW